MAVITLDTNGAGQFAGTGSSQTIASPTIGNNPGRVLLVGLWSTGGSSIPVPLFNGISMGSAIKSGSTGSTSYAIFLLVAPSTGSNNLTGTFSNGAGFGFMYHSLYNCSGTNPDNTGDSGSGSGTSVSLSITPNNDSEWVMFFGFTGNTISSLTGAGTNNQVSSFCHGNSSVDITGISGNSGTITPPSSQTATLNLTSSYYELLAICIKPLQQLSQGLSDSIMNADSRFATTVRSFVGSRASSVSIMNADSRFATVGRYIGKFRTVADSIMNAVSRFATVFSSGGIWKNNSKHSSAFANNTTHSASWVNNTKHTDTFINDPKSTP